MRQKAFAILATLALAALLAAPAAEAQSLSAEEMKKRFSAHRGLSLAPVSPAKPAATGSGTAATAATGGTATTAATGGTATTAARETAPASPSAPSAPGGTSAGTSGSGAGGASTTLSAAPSRAEPGSPVPPTPASEISAIAAAYRPVPEELRVDIQIQFEFDSAVLRPSEKTKLETVCTAMKESDVEVFHIFGHTDAAGSAAYNLTLSQLRADEVRRYLVSTCGMPAERLKAIGVGKEHLLDAANPRAPENRRVEFQAIS